MKRVLPIAIVALTFIGCSSNENKEPEVLVNRIPAVIPPEDNFYYDTLKGMYMGDFGGSDIRIILNYVSGSNAIGYNIHKGLTRNLSGKVERHGDSILIQMAEPGDHEFDGVFNLVFNGIDKSPTGTWESNSGKISAKNFDLKKVERNKEETDGLTAYNFSNYFSFLSDSLGNYHFERDGLCRYEYYPIVDDQEAEQLVEVNGSWSLTDSIVIIEWQPNKRFNKNRMVFIARELEYGERYLDGEGMELYGYWY